MEKSERKPPSIKKMEREEKILGQLNKQRDEKWERAKQRGLKLPWEQND
jgi:hypothetical protein